MDYDLIGIGFGPANISLAVALEELGWSGRSLFLERNAGPDWQADMLLDGTDIQHHPLRDFVTPRNPQSPYGFLSYLKSQGRLFDFLNLGAPYALRKDYAGYIRWVAGHFDDDVSYAEDVTAITMIDPGTGASRAPGFEVSTRAGKRMTARVLAFGPGRSALIPESFQPVVGERIVHFTSYLSAMSRWKADGVRSIAVVGGSQSAIEIVLDIHKHIPAADIYNVQRGFGYHLKDTSPFTEHAYFPDFVDYFHAMTEPHQRAMTADLRRSNYGAADHDVIHQLYLLMYEQRLDGRPTIHLRTNRTIDAVEITRQGTIALGLFDAHQSTRDTIEVDAVVLATGFRNFGSGRDQELFPPLLADVAPHVRRRSDNSFAISRDYRLELRDDVKVAPSIYMNGICESTHGFGDAGSFSLLALRSWTIANALMTDLRAAVEPRPRRITEPPLAVSA